MVLGGRGRAGRAGASGGVATGCAIAPEPKLVFADEPPGNLDAVTGEEIISLMFELNRERHTTLLLVTHDERIAGRCPRRLRLASGRIVEDVRV